MEKESLKNNELLKDVFISHAWKDKEEYIDKLVSELELSKITCWYDTFEILPGDSLVNKINYGLTHSKIIILCISDNFLSGKWAVEELETVISMHIKEKDLIRFIPIFIGKTDDLIKKYPLPLSKTAYVKWDNNLEFIVDSIKKVRDHIDGLGSEYWQKLSETEFRTENFEKATLYALRALEYDAKNFYSLILLIASLLKRGDYHQVYQMITDYEEEWDYFDDYNAPDDILNFAQKNVAENVTGTEIDKTEFSFAIVDFLASPQNNNSWKYLQNIFHKKKFSFHQNTIVMEIGLLGKAQAFDWLSKIANETQNEKVKENIISLFLLFLYKIPDIGKDKILSVIRPYLNDEFEDIRSLALIPFYFFDKMGSNIALNALNDQSPEVRCQAVELLTGQYNMIVQDDWTVKESHENRKPDALLTEDIVIKLLKDPDDDVLDEILDAINDEIIDCPKGIDLSKTERLPPEELREAQVTNLGKKVNSENYSRLYDFALNDPSGFVRDEAVRVLKEKEFTVNDENLLKLYKHETLHRVKNSIESLLLEKGGKQLGDVYFNILKKEIDSLWSGATAVKKIFETNDRIAIQKTVKFCIKSEKIDLLVDFIANLIEIGEEETVKIMFDYCFDNSIKLNQILLQSGLTNLIPIERIIEYGNHNDPSIRICSFRAEEKRKMNGEGLNKLKTLFNELYDKINEGDSEVQWAVLSIIDGVIEFDNIDNAIQMLKDFYNKITSEKDSSFPIRAAWERLKILGVIIPHKVYSKADPTVPDPWPSIEGPFYKKLTATNMRS